MYPKYHGHGGFFFDLPFFTINGSVRNRTGISSKYRVNCTLWSTTIVLRSQICLKFVNKSINIIDL